MRRIILNNMVHYALLSLVVFVILYNMLDLSFFITVLNGAFFGTMFGITAAYAPLFWRSLINDRELGGDVKQLTVSFLGSWMAYCLIIYVSVMVKASGGTPTVLFASALSRYIAIISAMGQITAPVYGKAFMYGAERKSLYIGVISGLVIALILIVAQSKQVLALELLG